MLADFSRGKFWYFCITKPAKIKKMWQVYDFFYVFFWLFGEKSVPLQ